MSTSQPPSESRKEKRFNLAQFPAPAENDVYETDDFPEFVSHPVIRGGHLQTLAPAFLGKPTDPQTGICHIVDLRDGDQIAVIDDAFGDWQSGDPIVVGMHGLTGCHRSQYMVRLRNQLEREYPCRLFRIDMRGYGDSTLLSRGHCCAGSYNDLADVVEWVHQQHPQSPIILTGFSLGANIILQYLGRDPASVPRQVQACFVVAPPIDLIRCSWNLRRGLNRLYDLSFIRSLHRQLHLRRRRVAGLRDLELRRLPSRLLQFDDEYTAIVSGFSGAREYYQQCSAAPLLPRIRVPTRIMLAKDDPVIPLKMFEDWPRSDSIRLHLTKTGGHLGYIGPRDGDGPRWLERRLVAWIQETNFQGKPASKDTAKVVADPRILQHERF